MKIHCLIHADFEQPGYFETWAKHQKITFNKTYLHRSEKIPALDDFDILLCLGGPQSANELEKYPYLKDELTLIKRAVAGNKYVIGICLGAQLIAASFGQKPEISPNKEVGVFPVKLTNAGKTDPFTKYLPETFLSAHWHNDMPGLPADVEVLATSEGCPRQIIRFTEKVYGFQCHLEFDRDCVESLVAHCPEDLTQDKFVQSAEAMLSEDYSLVNSYLEIFLQQLFAKIA